MEPRDKRGPGARNAPQAAENLTDDNDPASAGRLCQAGQAEPRHPEFGLALAVDLSSAGGDP